jgi:hypothetical protein
MESSRAGGSVKKQQEIRCAVESVLPFASASDVSVAHPSRSAASFARTRQMEGIGQRLPGFVSELPQL